MDFRAHLERAWRLTIQNLLPLIFLSLVMMVPTALSFGVLAPVLMAGYTQSLLMMVRSGRKPRMQDVFSEMGLFFTLLGFSLLVGLAVVIGLVVFVLPGVIMVLAISYSCLYLLPLMTDQRLSLTSALRRSWKMAIQKPVVDHLVLVILLLGVFALGSPLLITMLVTQPFATLLLVSVYDEKIRGTMPPKPL